MQPDWLGGPQHVVGGLAISVLAVVFARGSIGSRWVLAAFGISVAAAAELLFEIAEYLAVHAGSPNRTAYHDTLADMADTMIGALAGTAVALSLLARRG